MNIRHLMVISLIFISGMTVSAQMADGSVAPDFTATDINGNTHHLYDILNQGITVVLDISATWCGPCWNYHTSGNLESFYSTNGPGGTRKATVIMIEGDASTTLADLMGTGDNTQGNWVAGTEYPIIDSRAIAEAYQINYFPTVYMICPDRKLREVGQQSAANLELLLSDCPQPFGVNNARILQYSGFEGLFCETLHFQPAVDIQNFGTDTLTSAVVSMKLNGLPAQEITWSGSLSTYGAEKISFDSLVISDNTEIEITVSSPNGVSDDQPGDNRYTAVVEVAPNAETTILLLELRLDQYPFETYWEIRNDIGQLLYFDGNRRVIYSNDSDEGKFLTANELKQYEIALPSNGCYEFAIFDAANDGLNGNGYFTLSTPDGITIVQGGNFTSEFKTPFGVANTTGIRDNASILNLNPFPPDFCYSYSYTPAVTVRNLGYEDLTSLTFSIKGSQKNYPDASWQGSVPPGGGTVLTLPAIIVDSTDNITVAIRETNGVPDTFLLKNSFTRRAFRRKTPVLNWLADIQTDSKGYETYWEITDDTGTVLFKGGNPLVGTSGGGAGVASPGDPGAYQNNNHYLVNVNLPGPGCYHLKVLDDGGNGMAGGIFGVPNPYVKIRNPQVGVIVQTTGQFLSGFVSNIEAGEVSSSTGSPETANLRLFPNPAGSQLTVQAPYPGTYLLRIIDPGTGILLSTFEMSTSGQENYLSVPLSSLTSGWKILSVQHESKIMHARFMKD